MSLPEDRLEHRLPDSKPLLSAAEAVVEASRCLYCHDAPCIAACPTGIDIPTFIRKIATDNLRGLGADDPLREPARLLVRARLPGRGALRRRLRLQRLEPRPDRSPSAGCSATRPRRCCAKAGQPRCSSRAPANGKQVACVGAGPASLACARYLALEGVAVTIFEKRALRRRPQHHRRRALQDARRRRARRGGVGPRRSASRSAPASRSTPGPTAEALLRDHDAVFLGLGLGTDTRLGIPARDGPGRHRRDRVDRADEARSGALEPAAADRSLAASAAPSSSAAATPRSTRRASWPGLGVPIGDACSTAARPTR